MALTDTAIKVAKYGAKPVRLFDKRGLFLMLQPARRRQDKCIASRFGRIFGQNGRGARCSGCNKKVALALSGEG